LQLKISSEFMFLKNFARPSEGRGTAEKRREEEKAPERRVAGIWFLYYLITYYVQGIRYPLAVGLLWDLEADTSRRLLHLVRLLHADSRVVALEKLNILSLRVQESGNVLNVFLFHWVVFIFV